MAPQTAYAPELLDTCPPDAPDTSEPLSRCGSGVILLLDQEVGALVAVPTFCHRWDCPKCGRDRTRKARAQAAAGRPQRMITLTTRPRRDMGLEEGARWIRKRWTALARKIREEFGPFEYMAFLELHKSNWPHLHILTRGCYIPQRMLSDWWTKLTGSFKVHIQAITQTWKGVQEATKYYLKSAQQLHETCPNLPVYTLSRGWLPADYKDGDKPAGSYKFFCHIPLSWDLLEEALELCEATTAPCPDKPGGLIIHLSGPPNDAAQATINRFGIRGEIALLAALNVVFATPAAINRPIEDLQTEQWFNAGMQGPEF